MMKKFFLIQQIVFVFSVLRLQSVSAQEIGQMWGFDADGNTEGWTASTELIVSNGTLKATVLSPIGLTLVGPEFELTARKFGYIQIRMKNDGSETPLVFSWRGDSTAFGYRTINGQAGNGFYEYEDLISNSNEWKGQIQQITALRIQAPVGTEIEIDYIRIVSLGLRPEITNFKPLRTILKKNEIFPLTAVVKNNGDRQGEIYSFLKLPNEFELLEGFPNNEHGMMAPAETDTLEWMVRSKILGSYVFDFYVFAEADTINATVSIPIVDTYWVQDKFFLSAWSPPAQTTEAYDYYVAANFDQILSLFPNESSVSFAESYSMRCQVSAGDLLGQHRYLRAAENQLPEVLTPEILANLDPLIEQFKDRPAVWGYYLTDEPNAFAFENLGKAVAWLREKDPTRLSFINLYPTYADGIQLGARTYDEYVEKFIDTVKPEMLSYDHYHFRKSTDGTGYFNNLGIILKWASRYNIPFNNIIQAIGTDANNPEGVVNWRYPTHAEHRWLVYSSLAYGAKGIVWFHWDNPWGLTGCPNRDELYASIAQLNQEISMLGPVLLSLKNVGAWHTNALKLPPGALYLPANNLVKDVGDADLVLGLFKDEDDQDFIFLMNKNYKDSVTANITLNRNIQELRFFNVESGQWQTTQHQNTPEGTQFEAVFQPGGGTLYSVGALSDGVEFASRANSLQYELEQNYPNPFNPSTAIIYHLKIKLRVKLTIYNSLGKQVRCLVNNKEQEAGHYQIQWDGLDDAGQHVASGVHVFRLETGEEVQSRKMLLLK